MPYELRPFPTPTLRPDGEYLRTAWQRSVYPLARRMGVEIRLPDVTPQPYTRLAFEGLEFAKDHNRSGEYNSGVMRGFFQESRDIGNLHVLTTIAANAGLDRDAFCAALETGEYRRRTQELLRHAYEEMQIAGVPMFVIGSRKLPGLQSKEAIVAAIDEAAGVITSH